MHKLLQGSNSRTDSRLPNTFLNILLSKLQMAKVNMKLLFFKVALSALLRTDDFTLSKDNTPHLIIHVGDPTFSSGGEKIKSYFRHSITDQQGYGTSVAVHATSGITCPVAAITRIFKQIRPKFSGPLFVTFLVNYTLVPSLAQYG